MVNPDMRDILEHAAEMFRANYRQIDIEEFFADRSIDLADGSSKRTYAFNTLASLPQPQALEIVLELALSNQNFDLQESVYKLQERDSIAISEITRREIAKLIGTRLHGNGANSQVLGELFKLESFEDFFSAVQGTDNSKKRQLDDNATGGQPAWGAFEVFELIGAFRCSSRRFALLLDTALDPLMRDAEEQEELVQKLAPLLKVDQHEISWSSEISGRSKYNVRPIQRGVHGKPKNLVFASNGPKPLLGFSDAIDNEIVVLEHADSCLIYDRPFLDGLRWIELVQWWAEKSEAVDIATARKSLGTRLQESLDEGPEKEFFNSYFKCFASRLGDHLPALIPQVYLHYDPEVVRNVINRDALLRQRMDFLLLLPGRQRIVLEIDGKQHYAVGNIADPRSYAEMVSADRELRLRGYEVYRFGGYELSNNKTTEVAEQFFKNLFTAHRMI